MTSKRLTQAEARRAIKWFQRVMGLEDWQIRVAIQGEPPEWAAEGCTSDSIGRSWTRREWKKADVWVSPERCATDGGSDPLGVLFHEVLHVGLYDVDLGGTDKTPPQQEFMLDRLDAVFAFAYRKGMKEK